MKKIFITLTIIALIALGGIYFISQQTKTPSSIIQKSEKDTVSSKNDNSRYVEYSNAVLNQRTEGKRKVLFFYASWCPTCRPADANFRENVDQIPEDVILIRVNYNDPETDADEKALAEKYSITYQHTFVQIDENGNELTKWNGGQIDELLSNIR